MCPGLVKLNEIFATIPKFSNSMVVVKHSGQSIMIWFCFHLMEQGF